MSNREKILSYLSDLMSPEEKTKFEKELLESPALNEEFVKTREQLASLNECANVEINDMYFNTLVPRVRERLEQKPRRASIPQLSIATAASVIILVVSLFYYPSFTTRSNNGVQSLNLDSILASEDSSSISELFDVNFIHEYSAYYDKSFLHDISDFTDDLEYSSASKEEDVSSADYFSKTNTSELLNNMTSDELEDVYNALLNEKIL